MTVPVAAVGRGQKHLVHTVGVAATGVNVSVVRLPQVHDTVKQGLVTPLIAQFSSDST